MSDAVEVLRKDLVSYEELKKSGKKCLTTNNEECCFVHYPQIKEAVLGLEQLEKLKMWLDRKIMKEKDNEQMFLDYDEPESELMCRIEVKVLKEVKKELEANKK